MWGLSGQQIVSGGHLLGRAMGRRHPDTSSAVWARRILMMAAAMLVALPDDASAQAFWNWGPADYYDQRPVRPKRIKIKRKADPAEASAKAAAKPVGPLVIAVSVEKQRVKVYDSNGLFAEAPVSTGTKSHPTPMGVFSIIQKNRHHVSNLYNASMPYMQRITWSGVAMHTGPLPGYAASHGCIRLPNEFAARLWTWTKMGTRVIVAPGEVSPANFTHPKLVAKMMPLPTVSAAPAPVVAADAVPSTANAARRTADARDAIAGMKGTLSDVSHSAPVETTIAEPKAADDASEAKASSTSADIGVGLKQLGVTATNEVLAGARGETKPIEAAEKPAQVIAAADGLAVKPEDRNNTDESDGDATAQIPARTDKAAEPKAAETQPAVKPVDALPDIAKPADIAKTPEVSRPPEAKPADVASPTAEPAKPTITVTPRRHNHVAVFISRKDKRLYVRHGYEPVYDTPIEIADADRPLGTHVFTARGDKDDATALHWTVVSLPQLVRNRAEPRRSARQGRNAAPAQTHSPIIPALNAADALDRIAIPAEAMERIAAIITPGGSLLISDHGLYGWETGKGTDFIVPLRQ
jgi:hypothetical protein